MSAADKETAQTETAASGTPAWLTGDMLKKWEALPDDQKDRYAKMFGAGGEGGFSRGALVGMLFQRFGSKGDGGSGGFDLSKLAGFFGKSQG